MRKEINLLKKISRKTTIAQTLKNGDIRIENKQNRPQKIRLGTFDITKSAQVTFKGTMQKKDYTKAYIQIVDGSEKVKLNINREHYITSLEGEPIQINLVVAPGTCIDICQMFLSFKDKKQDVINNTFQGDVLFIAPGFPSQENLYNYAFVYDRVCALMDAGMKVDIISANLERKFSQYKFKKLLVNESSYLDVRSLLQRKSYDKIIIHYFSTEICQVLEGVDITKSDIFIFAHGSDFLYRQQEYFSRKYFKDEQPPKSETIVKNALKDKLLCKYSNLSNVRFIFPTQWMKTQCEKQNNVIFKNAIINPSPINKDIFKYQPKKAEQRKKVCIVRKYDNLATYGIDLTVRAILELSRRPCFKDMEFTFYGDGPLHDKLLRPLRQFKNVKIEKRFLSHQEMAKVYKESGIAVFSTRMETFGVAAAEAALAGNVVITHSIAAVPEVFSGVQNELLVPPEDYQGIADLLENLYNNPKQFLQLSYKCHDEISKKYDYDEITKRDLDIVKTELPKRQYKPVRPKKEKILTISIAAYNAEKFLKKSILSIIESNVADKVEVLIIDDGSTDNTSAIGKYFEKLTTYGQQSIVRYIKKENGGHGSTINKGIELAQGKYFKLLDADDYFDTRVLEQLIEILEREDSDLILTNYVEDLADKGFFNPQHLYNQLQPGKQYFLDDLCYDGYGFGKWGPLLSTTTVKTEKLQQVNFKISENRFYVDMEFNAAVFSVVETLAFYPLDLYYYFMGRAGQSISRTSFKKNYKDHEHVIFRIINDIYNKIPCSHNKKEYIRQKIICPLIATQYLVLIDFFGDSTKFQSFDQKLKQYPEFYNHPKVAKAKVKVLRRTNGYFIKNLTKIGKAKHSLDRFFSPQDDQEETE